MSIEFDTRFTVCCGLISKKTTLEARIRISQPRFNIYELNVWVCLPTTSSASPCFNKEKRFHNVGFLISRICEAVVSCERYARGRDVSLETSLTDPRN